MHAKLESVLRMHVMMSNALCMYNLDVCQQFITDENEIYENEVISKLKLVLLCM